MSHIPGVIAGVIAGVCFCESIHAYGLSPWHLRRPTSAGLKLTGGIDTSSLCGRVSRGWDLDVPVTESHFEHTCRDCLAVLKKEKS
jgi:hypothetical protein